MLKISTITRVFSLLFFVNCINGGGFKADQYQKFLKSVTDKRKTIIKEAVAVKKAEALFDTKEYKLYQESFDNWQACLTKEYELKNEKAYESCIKSRENITQNFKKLQSTTEYGIFLPVQSDDYYYGVIESALSDIIKINDKYRMSENFSQESKNNKLKEVINSRHPSCPADAHDFLEWPKDMHQIHANALKELHRIVMAVEKSDRDRRKVQVIAKTLKGLALKARRI